MSIGPQLGGGFKLLVDSVKVLFKEPIFLVPIFFSWILVSATILYVRYYLPEGMIFITIFGFIFLMTMIISLANIVMLEFMEQIETGKKISFSKAIKEAVFLDLLKVIPVALIWAIVWFILLVIRILTSKKKERSSRPEPSMQDAAMALGGDKPFSWWGLGLDLIEKVVRMFIFLSLPAIAWENKGPFSAFKKAFQIVRKHPLQFLTTYTLTGVVALIMGVPLVIIFSLAHGGVSFPPVFWTIVIIYISIIWTLGIYLEQMSVGLLYLWHLKWVKNGSKGDLSSVKKPDLLDDIRELKV
ncbi:hypothetical protein HYX02_01900 [Candidatus Woesearchaeota archaeon]|nr:hypothetical protein [Candidatus Woesearchaeota archaeon]